jgi:hypothetical protein
MPAPHELLKALRGHSARRPFRSRGHLLRTNRIHAIILSYQCVVLKRHVWSLSHVPGSSCPILSRYVPTESVKGGADQAGLAAGVLDSSRQAGGALAVAVFGVLVSRSPGTFASFTSGMRDSMLIAAVLLAASTTAAFTALRRRHGSAVLRPDCVTAEIIPFINRLPSSSGLAILDSGSETKPKGQA